MLSLTPREQRLFDKLNVKKDTSIKQIFRAIYRKWPGEMPHREQQQRVGVVISLVNRKLKDAKSKTRVILGDSRGTYKLG